MDAKDSENDYVLNFKLFRWTALYQMLDPAAANAYGHNVYRVFAACAILVISVMAIPLLVRMFYMANAVNEFAFFLGCAENFYFAAWKMYVVLRHSGDVWEHVRATGLGAMAYGHYDRGIFVRWRSLSKRITYAYAALSAVSLVSVCLVPLAMPGASVSIEQPDGSYGEYRMNIFNFYRMVPDEWHNDHFVGFYLAEATLMSGFMYVTFVFDLLLFTMILSLYYKFEMISDAIESLGHDDASTTTTSDSIIKDRVFSNVVRDNHDDLRTILKDHQHVIKLMDDYYNIFRSTYLIEIIVMSSSLTFTVFITLINFVGGNVGDFILNVKMISEMPIFMFQLLTICYLFGLINKKKDSIVFALYSSNWTEMDLKGKKLILLAMRMNNANQMKLKLTSTKIIDLEMFTSTMRVCYSIISMLSNYSSNTKTA